jgi:chromatin modification-related protein YNG2
VNSVLILFFFGNAERRTTTAPTSIKLAPVAAPTPPRRSASPLTSATVANSHNTSHKRSRLSRQIHPREDVDMDAEGDEDGEGEDENLYCFCQKQSYGDVRSLSLSYLVGTVF